MIFIGQKRFRKALDLLHDVHRFAALQFTHNCSSLNIVGVIEQILISLVVFQVLTAPMSSINALGVQAYKKYILVSLIHHG